MAIKKNILVDGIEVPFKASAAVPRLFRLKGFCCTTEIYIRR